MLLATAQPVTPPRGESPSPGRDDQGGKALLDRLDAWGDDSQAPQYQFVELLGRIRNDPSISVDVKMDRLLRYADGHPRNRAHVLAMLTDWRCPRLGPWLLERGPELAADDWRAMFQVLSAQYVELDTWRDPRVVQAFFAEITNSNDEIRASGVGGVSLAGNAGQAVALLSRLTVDSHSGIRYYIYAAQTRFNTPQGNAAVRMLLKNYKEPSVIESIIADDMVRNHRHDFLPDLKRLRGRLAAVTDVAQRDAARKMISAIDAATSHLESDKKNGVPVGERLRSP
jgi:hypothetical protein